VKVLPFVAIEAVVVFLIAYVPQISLWLPSLVGY
jgi:C4-dicarboxylate transporter DctM subunit